MKDISLAGKLQGFFAPGDRKQLHGVLEIDLQSLSVGERYESDRILAMDGLGLIIRGDGEIVFQQVPPWLPFGGDASAQAVPAGIRFFSGGQ